MPVVPGCDVVSDAEQAKQEAEAHRLPAADQGAQRAAAGAASGCVDTADEVERAFLAASSRGARRAFGDGGVLYGEVPLTPVKHIEMQLLCDHYGNVVCLGERECSMQRNNQKMIEESPAPSIMRKDAQER